METVDNASRPGRPLDRICALLYGATGIDFERYKRGTIERRTLRRMRARGIPSVEEYARRIEADRTELDALAQDVLILTTRFFRDPAAFEALRAKTFGGLFAGRGARDPVRVWSVGCSTGEEAYTIAILLLEWVDEHGLATPLHIFATDVSDVALRQARDGLYPPRLAEAVSGPRLRRFFTPANGGHRIARAVRNVCFFTRHDVTRDPPFGHLDLILCRNVLIYMETPLQRDVLARLHWALRPGGVLMLGTAEAILGESDLFHTVDRRNAIYVKEPALVRTAVDAARETPRSPESGNRHPARAARRPARRLLGKEGR